MIGYVAGASWLHRAHPFAAFLLAGWIVVVAILVPAPTISVIFAAIVAAWPLAIRAYRAAGTAALMSLPFWFFLLVIHGAIRGDPTTAVVLASRLTAMIFGFTTVIGAVHPARMTEALVQAGAPFSVAYLFSATLQTIPRLRERAVAILETQQCRGLDLRGSSVRRVRNLVPLAVPLVLGALTEVDDRAVALETRGAAAGRTRTPLDPPIWSNADRMVAWFAGLSGVSVVGWWWLR